MPARSRRLHELLPLCLVLFAACGGADDAERIGEVEQAGAANLTTDNRWYGVTALNRLTYYTADATHGVGNMVPARAAAIATAMAQYKNLTPVDTYAGKLSNGVPTSTEPYVIFVDYDAAGGGETYGYCALARKACAQVPAGCASYDCDAVDTTALALWTKFGGLLRPAATVSGKLRHEDYLVRVHSKPTTGEYVGTILHETGHVLGLMHEQDRMDACEHILVSESCMGAVGQDKYSQKPSTYLSPYDIKSIMQYPSEFSCAKDDADECICYPFLEATGCSLTSDPDCSWQNNDVCPWPATSGTGTLIPRMDSLSAEDLNVFYQMYPPQLDSELASDQLGAAVAAGDFDGDGYTDLAVGAPHDHSTHVGGISLYKGTYTGLMPWRFIVEPPGPTPPSQSDQFGASLAAADLDGDGKSDLVVGAPGRSSGVVTSGVVFVLSGTTRGLGNPVVLHAGNTGFSGTALPAAADRYGAAVAIGDFDEDGSQDIAIGAPGKPRVYVVERSGSSWTKMAEYGSANYPNDDFGVALTAGDLNMDGAADLVIGSPETGWSSKFRYGKVYVWPGQSGGTFGTMITVPNPASSPAVGDAFGSAVAVGLFIPFSHVRSLAVGAPGRSSGNGAVYHFEDGVNFQSPVELKLGDFGGFMSGDRFGTALAAADLDGSAGSELVVGAPGGPFGWGYGVAGIYQSSMTSGKLVPLKTIAQGSLHGASATNQHFGQSLAVGNFNGSGRFDLAVGEPGRNTDAGAVWLFAGSCTTSSCSGQDADDEHTFTRFLSQGESLTTYRR